jgi:SAM-dependent methyltransferase
MDRTRFSTIAHRDHVYCNPIGAEKIDRVLALLDLSPVARVIDVGCGKGELLARVAERYGASGVGIDTNGEFLREARARVESRAPGVAIDLREVDFAKYDDAPGAFAAGFCIGATHACGGYRAALRALARLVRPGGHVVVGEGYWRQAPSAEYLKILDATFDELGDHAENAMLGFEEGLVPLYAAASSRDEWDHYEGLYARAIERHVAEHPDDPDASEMTKRIRKWRRAYLEHGRDTLGFGLYVFVKDGAH